MRHFWSKIYFNLFIQFEINFTPEVSPKYQNKTIDLVYYSDLQGVMTNARKDGDDWILNGSKTFITNGYMADVVIVVTVTKPDAKSRAHGISLFLVEDGMPGFKKGRKLDKMGLKAQVITFFLNDLVKRVTFVRKEKKTLTVLQLWQTNFFK